MITNKDVARRNHLQEMFQSGVKLTQKEKDELLTLSMEIAELPKETYKKMLTEI